MLAVMHDRFQGGNPAVRRDRLGDIKRPFSELVALLRASAGGSRGPPRRYSVFFKDETGDMFRTYSTFARGIDMMSLDYQYLDLVPRRRGEGDRGPYWVQRHDEQNNRRRDETNSNEDPRGQ
jgi:hypothetical protein